MKSRLLAATLAALDNRPRKVTLAIIARDCDVSEQWLRSLLAGRIPNPGVCKIEELYTYLTKHELEV